MLDFVKPEDVVLWGGFLGGEVVGVDECAVDVDVTLGLGFHHHEGAVAVIAGSDIKLRMRRRVFRRRQHRPRLLHLQHLILQRPILKVIRRSLQIKLLYLLIQLIDIKLFTLKNLEDFGGFGFKLGYLLVKKTILDGVRKLLE